MTESKTLLEAESSHAHLVQLYSDPGILVENVSRFLAQGARRGEWMIVIASPRLRERFASRLRALDVDVDSLLGSGNLTLLDSAETLDRFLVDGHPDWDRFERVVGRLVQDGLLRAGPRGFRAYGDMVDLLWKEGRLAAATKLEEFWNRLIERNSFRLFCAYEMEIPGTGVDVRAPGELLRTHARFLPQRRNGELDQAVHQAMGDVLGAQAAGTLLPLIESTKHTRADLSKGEATVLWLRRHLPPFATRVLNRTRIHYESLCAAQAGGPT